MLRYLNQFSPYAATSRNACLHSNIVVPQTGSPHWLCERLQSWLHADSLDTAADTMPLDFTRSFRFALTLQHIKES